MKSSSEYVNQTDFQLLINRMSEGTDKTVNSVKASLQAVDSKIFKSFKDLTRVVNDNKKNTEKLNKTVSDHSRKIDVLETNVEKQASSLDDIINIQNKIMEKIDDSERTFGKKISELQNLLQRQTEQLERDIAKVEDTSEKNNKGIIPGIMSALGGAAGMEIFKRVFPVAMAGVFGVYMGNIVGRKINEALKPIKHALGYTAENFPEMAKLSERLKTEGITNVLSENIRELQGEDSKGPLSNIFGSFITSPTQTDIPKEKQTDPDAEKVNVPSQGGPPIGTGRYTDAGRQYSGQKISNPIMAKDIYDYLRQKGIDHVHAVGILANLQNESKFDSGAIGDNGTSGGLFQHHNERFTAMRRAAGPEWQKNWKGQIDYALSEGDMQKFLRKSFESGQAAASSFVYDFERPADKPGEAAKRAANVGNVEKLVGGGEAQTKNIPTPTAGLTPQAVTGTTPPSSTTTTSTATQVSSSTPMNTEAPKLLPDGRPVQAQIPGTESKSGDIPKGDIVALGKYLQSQGILISEHPSFGGVKMGGHTPNSAHYRGEAIDVNAPGGIVEANDPVWGKKFDAVAEQLKAAGYKVIWKAAGHFNHLHAQLGGGSSGHETQEQGTTGTGASPTTSPTMQGLPPSGGQAMTPPSPTMGVGMPPTMGMPGMGMGMPGMGMMGGMGGIGMLAGLIGPLASSLLGGLMQPNIQAPQIAPQQEMLTTPTQQTSQANANTMRSKDVKSPKVVEPNVVSMNSRPDWLGDLAEGLLGSSYSGMSKPKYFGAGVSKV